MPPDITPPLIETIVETPIDDVVTTGDSAIPITALNATALLFPVSLFAVTTSSGPTNDTPGPAAAIPFVVGAALVAQRKLRARR